jgi:hypothetical protein
LRAFAAAGATIVVGEGDGAFYGKVLSSAGDAEPLRDEAGAAEGGGELPDTHGGRCVNRRRMTEREPALIRRELRAMLRVPRRGASGIVALPDAVS